MNPPYEQRRDGPRPIITAPNPTHFICVACRKPGVSDSPNAKYHQTRECQAVKRARSYRRAVRRKQR